ncbi:P-loop containing nucleoside triphosphate hydrolase protein [Fomitopsis serialis]|uniref:P-loop containing nucleoside triphosphate hydrolase protein n=1 Tax=Fomitopsis serialis TaxID=139415 RepID=UPI0020073B4E|nr:P-loop containing nucleoside triphosphate hydrolase protein [Neoantrodia serialis]KAH9920611.1 P-loop containing nucleoside triphosphate hydrolase protein [Neoantrodia serialis]
MLACPQDTSFGPASTCRDLDFTLQFEQMILSFTPDVIFVAFAALRLAACARTKSLLGTPGWPLVLAKLISVLLTTASTAANLFFALRLKEQDLIPIWVASPALQLVSSIPLAFLVLVEHFRSPAPSMLIICYTLLKSLFCSVLLRSYLKIGLFSTARSGAVALTLVTASYMLVLCAELVEKRRLLRHKVLAPVSTSSFFSRSLYFWLFPLLWNGRKKVLTIDDCGMIPDGLSALSTRSALQNALSTTGQRSNYLVRATVKAFAMKFLAPAGPRLALLLVTFAQPLLVNRTISFVTSENSDTQGWALVGAFVCVYALIAITTSLYWEKVYDATVGLRGALVGVIYSKSLKLSSAASRSLGGGVASTYMSVDVERVCEGAQSFHEIWACLASVGMTIAIVYHQATWPAFLPIAVTALLLIATSFVGRYVGRQQSAWLAATDRRVKFISSMISNSLSIKWSCYEEVLAAKAGRLRQEEMDEARKFYNGIALSAALANTAGTLCILSVLGPYVLLAARNGRAPLDVNRLFTIVTTLNLVSQPLSFLGQHFPILAASWASLKRIQTFLLLDECPGDQLGSNEKFENLYEATDGVELETCTPPAITMTQASFAGRLTGKSLLLLSILGETTCTAGQYSKPSTRFAYASQDALIIPGTIRENILFGRAFQAERYSRVIDACALTADVRKMPAGDGTWLGERGRRLSGGQKQRIALARAVYADAPWTLLDDPLSALDAESESHIFSSLFGPDGMLVHKAVVLVTHSVKHMHAAHSTVVLGAGRIQHQGSLQDFIKQGYEALVEIATPAADPSAEDAREEEIGEAALKKESLGLSPYRFYIRMIGRLNFIIAMSGIALYTCMRLGLQVYLQQWADSNGARPGAWAGGYAGFSILTLIGLAFTFWQFSVLVAYRGGLAVHAEELKGLVHAAPSFFMSTPAGRIINRFSQDIFLIDFEWPVNLLDALAIVLLLIGTLIFIFIPTPLLTLSVIPLGAFYYLTTTFYLRTSKQLQHLEASSKSPLYSVFATTLSGIETIRALRVEGHLQKQNDVYLNRSQTPYYYRFGGIRFLRTVLAFISFAIAVSLAALTIGLRRTINPSSLGLALSNLTGLSNWLSALLMCLAEVENGSVSISRIHEIVTLPPEEDSAAYVAFDENWPSAGSVEFKGVSMRYQPDLQPAVSDVSFRASAGMKIGICGRSGSGKSSMILALFRGLDDALVSGQVTIDGVDIHTLPRARLRKALSLVAQDPFVWHASIRSNLDPEEAHEDADIWAALDRVGMGDAVAELPEKLDTVLEDGGSLSKGQLQLLCLSRVLLRRRKIVVLDEASSSLDLRTDEKIRAVIRTELSECTVIAVAHRIVDFDLILVMDDGALVEHGAPDELLARRDGRFARLAASQGVVRKHLR